MLPSEFIFLNPIFAGGWREWVGGSFGGGEEAGEENGMSLPGRK